MQITKPKIKTKIYSSDVSGFIASLVSTGHALSNQQPNKLQHKLQEIT